MRWWLIALAACGSAPAATGIELADLDRSADPCTDFYQFATGGWRAAHPAPAGAAKWSRRTVARETNRRQLAGYLEQVSRSGAPAGSPEQVLGDYYASCLDEAAVDAAGLTPLAPWLAPIDATRTPADIQRAIRTLHEIGVAVPFGVAGTPAYREPARFIASVVATGLDREVIASDRHRARIASLLSLAGARDDTAAIVALETRLAAASLAPAAAADLAATDHPMTFAQLEELAPHVEWRAYFDEAQLPRGELNVAEPAYLRQLDRELVEAPVAVWAAYLRYQLLEAASPWLAKGFGESGTSRPARCVDSTEALFGEPLGRAYAAAHFSPAAKTQLQALVRGLMATLHDAVAATTWMEPETKALALAKADAIEVELGYPEIRRDRATTAIRRDALWANAAAARRRKVLDERAMIGRPTPRDWWQLPASSPDAYIEPLLNQMVLPAGYLQRPIFDPAAPDAFNYGAIGVGIAHDLTHSIDASGSALDRMGRPVSWWTDADRAAFGELGRCMSDQFTAYEIEPGVHLDGARVLSEVIGDLAGIQLAYAALDKLPPGPVVDGFTPAQQFFLAWAQFRGESMTLEAQRAMVATDSHPVPKFRINGTLANSREFARAFSCKPDSAMAHAKPCPIWLAHPEVTSASK